MMHATRAELIFRLARGLDLPPEPVAELVGMDVGDIQTLLDGCVPEEVTEQQVSRVLAVVTAKVLVIGTRSTSTPTNSGASV